MSERKVTHVARILMRMLRASQGREDRRRKRCRLVIEKEDLDGR